MRVSREIFAVQCMQRTTNMNEARNHAQLVRQLKGGSASQALHNNPSHDQGQHPYLGALARGFAHDHRTTQRTGQRQTRYVLGHSLRARNQKDFVVHVTAGRITN